MRKFLKTTPLLILLIFLTSCDWGYEKKNGKVYYVSYNSTNGKSVDYVKGADPNTFKAVRNKYFMETNFGKDKIHVFYMDKMQKGVSPKKFRNLGKFFYADHEKAYFLDENRLEEIKGVNPKKLKVLEIYPWAIEGNNVINGSKTVKISDVEHFQPLNRTWAKTEKLIIYKDTIITDGDPASFHVGSLPYEGSDRFRKYNMLHYR